MFDWLLTPSQNSYSTYLGQRKNHVDLNFGDVMAISTILYMKTDKSLQPFNNFVRVVFSFPISLYPFILLVKDTRILFFIIF